MIRELGADEIVRDGKGLAAAGGADVILGTSNSADAMAESIAGLRPDGRLVLMGLENKPLPVQPLDLIARRIRVLGSRPIETTRSAIAPKIQYGDIESLSYCLRCPSSAKCPRWRGLGARRPSPERAARDGGLGALPHDDRFGLRFNPLTGTFAQDRDSSSKIPCDSDADAK